MSHAAKESTGSKSLMWSGQTTDPRPPHMWKDATGAFRAFLDDFRWVCLFFVLHGALARRIPFGLRLFSLVFVECKRSPFLLVFASFLWYLWNEKKPTAD